MMKKKVFTKCLIVKIALIYGMMFHASKNLWADDLNGIHVDCKGMMDTPITYRERDEDFSSALNFTMLKPLVINRL